MFALQLCAAASGSEHHRASPVCDVRVCEAGGRQPHRIAADPELDVCERCALGVRTRTNPVPQTALLPHRLRPLHLKSPLASLRPRAKSASLTHLPQQRHSGMRQSNLANSNTQPAPPRASSFVLAGRGATSLPPLACSTTHHNRSRAAQQQQHHQQHQQHQQQLPTSPVRPACAAASCRTSDRRRSRRRAQS